MTDLQAGDVVRVVDVLLASLAPVVVARVGQHVRVALAHVVREPVTAQSLVGQHLERDAVQTRRSALRRGEGGHGR